MSKVNLSVNICGVEFKNPLIAASGTFGFGREYNEFYPISMLGGISTKGTTLKPRLGNPTPRIAETPSGILNAVGLQNPGVEHFIKYDLPFLKESGTKIIANVAGSSFTDYEEICSRLNGLVDMIELNISCPNVKEGGVAFGIKPESVEEITKRVKAKLTDTPLMAKLSPNVASISDNARAAEFGGADCISLINTLTGMAIDLERRKPIIANVTGGMSGPAVKPVALRMVYEACKAVKIPVIGLGGISNYRDVLEFMLVGARAVQVGTANFTNPMVMPQILEDLEEYMIKNGIDDINDVVGQIKI